VVARLLKLVLLLQALAVLGLWYLAMAVWHIAEADVALVLALLILLLCRALVVVNNFTLSWYYRSATPGPFRLSPWQRCRLFADELASTLICSSWTMAWPGPTSWQAPRPLSTAPPILPVLLVHGYAGNHGYWKPLRRRLMAAGIDHLAIDLEPVTAAIDDYEAQVAAAVATLCRQSDSGQVIIIAHSMGGLVARAYLRKHGVARIARVITLGTPHHGTGLADFGIGSNSAQMRRGGDGDASAEDGPRNAWLDGMAAMEDAARRALFTSIFSHHDNLIAPQTSAYFPGAKNLEFGAIGHVTLGRAPRILDCVMAEIALATRAGESDAMAR
jgi:pimeloyl-ACP methyl ester carboxylesterase